MNDEGGVDDGGEGREGGRGGLLLECSRAIGIFTQDTPGCLPTL